MARGLSLDESYTLHICGLSFQLSLSSKPMMLQKISRKVYCRKNTYTFSSIEACKRYVYGKQTEHQSVKIKI
eukprot:jgi/Botrbrau1/6333/Bobra.0339s0040.1